MNWFKKLIGKTDLKESAQNEPVDDKKKASRADFEERLGMGRVSDILYGFNPQKAVARLRESTNPDIGTEFDDKFFTPLGAAGGIDLAPQTQISVQRLSNLEYRKNVRAYRMIEMTAQFAFGGGVKFKATDSKVNGVLNEFWEANDWEAMLDKRMKSLGIFGEQLYPAFVNEKTGLVTISSISPLKIKRVERHREDAERLISVVANFSRANVSVANAEDPRLDSEDKRYGIILRRRVDGKLGMEEFVKNDESTSGPAFFFAVNLIAGASRGQPDITPSIDWLEGLDGYIWSLLERAKTAGEVVHDLTYEGAVDTEVQSLVQDFVEALNGGGVFGHNDKVTHKISSPNVGAAESEKIVSVLLKQIQSGTGMAGLFFGDAADLTRAAASELTTPVAKMIQARQDFFKLMLKTMFKFQIQSSIEAGVLDANVDQSFIIDMPRVFLRDMTTITNALVSLTNALTNAVDMDWITNEGAAKVYKVAQAELGDFVDTPTGSKDNAKTPDEEALSEAYGKTGDGDQK